MSGTNNSWKFWLPIVLSMLVSFSMASLAVVKNAEAKNYKRNEETLTQHEVRIRDIESKYGILFEKVTNIADNQLKGYNDLKEMLQEHSRMSKSTK